MACQNSVLEREKDGATDINERLGIIIGGRKVKRWRRKDDHNERIGMFYIPSRKICYLIA